MLMEGAIERVRESRTGEMTEEEIRRFLLDHEWGMLATVGEGRPYAVPVSYGFDGRSVYVATGPGRKRTNLETCPAVSLTVAEVESGDRWSSVVVSGDAEPVHDLGERIRGLRAIHRQRSTHALPSAADVARAARATLFRITPAETTGRVRGW